jgi:hypothetical protein
VNILASYAETLRYTRSWDPVVYISPMLQPFSQ